MPPRIFEDRIIPMCPLSASCCRDVNLKQAASEIGTSAFPAIVCASTQDRQQFAIGVGFRNRRLIMKYGLLMLAAAGLWSSQISAGELQSVYVAPGGVYIASARVYVAPGPGNGDPPYVAPGLSYGAPGYGGPGYGPPGPAYRAPAYYGAPRP